MEGSGPEPRSDRSIKRIKKDSQQSMMRRQDKTHSEIQRQRTENDKAWSEIQRQRVECLLRTSNESGLCGACDLIDESANFSHHDYTGLCESAQMCQICRLFLDSVKKVFKAIPHPKFIQHLNMADCFISSTIILSLLWMLLQ